MIAIVAGHRIPKDQVFYPGTTFRQMYASPYYFACMKYALEHVHESRVYILSRKHGLVKSLAIPKEPWDSQLPSHDDRILDQFQKDVLDDAYDLGVLQSADQILALCAGPYLEVLYNIFTSRIVAPIAGLTTAQALARLQTPLPVTDLHP